MTGPAATPGCPRSWGNRRRGTRQRTPRTRCIRMNRCRRGHRRPQARGHSTHNCGDTPAWLPSLRAGPPPISGVHCHDHPTASGKGEDDDQKTQLAESLRSPRTGAIRSAASRCPPDDDHCSGTLLPHQSPAGVTTLRVSFQPELLCSISPDSASRSRMAIQLPRPSPARSETSPASSSPRDGNAS